MLVKKDGTPVTVYHAKTREPYHHVFCNKSIWKAAKKAASRGFTHFYMLNKKTGIIREYEGGVEDIDTDELTDEQYDHLEALGKTTMPWVRALGPVNSASRKRSGAGKKKRSGAGTKKRSGTGKKRSGTAKRGKKASPRRK